MRGHTAAIFLDVSKAYDTIWTMGFVSKIYTAAVPDDSPLLLADHKFRVTMGATFSE
jgi:hypothetical protein